jgi:predicted nucleic acid-binding protein
VEAVFDEARICVIPVDRSIARCAARPRSQHSSLRLPDAISLATAQSLGATLLTLDKKLQLIAKAP